ncbi:MAG: rod shape-determining protein MreC [Eubacterium sp.]|nr:rod shape-determining protein MreC [Eubacterium sp.]
MKRKSKFKFPIRLLLFILTALCVAGIFVSYKFGFSGGPLSAIAGYMIVPMQRGINYVGYWISDKADNLEDLKDVMEENVRLKTQVDELTTQLNTLRLEQYELDNLRELLKIDQEYSDYQKVAASVIGKDAGNWFSVFTIDKGKNDGIETDMNVIAGQGLVGIVTDVGPNYAKVRSIIDDESNVSAMIAETKATCFVHGDLQEMNTNKQILFSDLKDLDDKVEENMDIVTSNISDKYLQGIMIGKISKIEKDANNLTKSGTIIPAVDFEHLGEVLVILDKKEIGKEDK